MYVAKIIFLFIFAALNYFCVGIIYWKRENRSPFPKKSPLLKLKKNPVRHRRFFCTGFSRVGHFRFRHALYPFCPVVGRLFLQKNSEKLYNWLLNNKILSPRRGDYFKGDDGVGIFFPDNKRAGHKDCHSIVILLSERLWHGSLFPKGRFSPAGKRNNISPPFSITTRY